MGFDLHDTHVLNGSTLALSDRLTVGLLPQQAYAAGNGTVTAIAAGSHGLGYTSIPTVAVNRPSSGAKATGSGAAATALMGVYAVPAITAAGTGGTPGAVTLTGSTGTGTKFQLTGVIEAGGTLQSISAVTVIGSYSALPADITAAAVTGGSLSGCTVNLTGCLGVAGYTVGSAGTHYPVGLTTASVSGGSPTTPAVPGAVTVTTAAGDSCIFDVSGLSLPATYSVLASLDQDAIAYVTTRTQAGFRVTINPRLAASSLAAGVADLFIVA